MIVARVGGAALNTAFPTLGVPILIGLPHVEEHPMSTATQAPPVCRGCGRPEVELRGVCWACYDKVQTGLLGEHVLAPLAVLAGDSAPIYSTVTPDPPAALRLVDRPPATAQTKAQPRCAQPGCGAPVARVGGRCRKCSHAHLRKAPPAAAIPAAAPAPVASVPAAPAPKARQTRPARPPSLDRLIADLGAARKLHAALTTTIADLETQIRARIPADLLCPEQAR